MKFAPTRVSVVLSLMPMMMAPAIAAAGTPEAIATGPICSACHLVDKKKLGPSYHDIATKNKGNAKAPAELAAKVRTGSKGVWGPVPMPPADAKKISDADLAAVIGWILSQ